MMNLIPSFAWLPLPVLIMLTFPIVLYVALSIFRFIVSLLEFIKTVIVWW